MSNNKNQDKTINIFIIGAIYSGIGKGVFAAALGKILEKLSYKVLIKKIDGYLNVDAGTINPVEHGEVFVTEDGQESDMDLGTYERFMSYETQSHHINTLGKVLYKILREERSGDLLGKTMEYFHLENKIIDDLYHHTQEYEIVIVEMGGVIGDDGNASILRAISKVENKIVLFMSYALWLEHAQEYKVRATTIALQTLIRNYGIKPDLFIMRSHKELSLENKEYFYKRLGDNFKKCKTKESFLFLPDLYSSYLIYGEILKNNPWLQELNNLIKEKFPMAHKDITLEEPLKYLPIIHQVGIYHAAQNTPQSIKILLLGKYDSLDSYSSIYHSMAHSASYLNTHIQLEFRKAETFSLEEVKNYDAMIIPGGFGYGKTNFMQGAIRIVRENNIPFLGICFGMQLAFLEGLNNLCNIPSTSSEFYSEAPELKDYAPAIDLVENWKKDSYADKIIGLMGGSMRLGSYKCQLTPNSQVYKAYNSQHIVERHRHRYEINQNYVKFLQEKNYAFTGICEENNLIEVLEYVPNDFFVAVQFHPEFKSKIEKPHPLFSALIQAAKIKQEKGKTHNKSL